MGCGCNKKKDTSELTSRAQNRQNRKENISKILENSNTKNANTQKPSNLPLVSANKKPILKTTK